MLALWLGGSLAGCAAAPDAHIPTFAKAPYEPFSRQAVVSIAIREWRLFGEPIFANNDGAEARADEGYHPEQVSSLWQRIGEYWWLALPGDQRARSRTGKHDERGVPFKPGDDAPYAWSAVFVSYVMRIAGAGAGFPYAPAHADYINEAWRASVGQAPPRRVWAERIETYAPQLGDLICFGRAGNFGLRFESLPIRRFASHCDIVVDVAPRRLSVIGGNVGDAVTLKQVPVTEEGRLAGSDGPIDRRFPWFVVIRVLYDR